MLVELFIPLRFTGNKESSNLFALILGATWNAALTIFMVFAMTWAVHKGWTLVG